MSPDQDITAAIAASSAIQQVTGGRFYWDIADAKTPAPYIVAQTISEDGQTCHDGGRGTGFATIQFAAWAISKGAAANVAEIFRMQLEGVKLPGDRQCVLTFSNRNSTYDPATRLFGVVIDMRANYQL